MLGKYIPYLLQWMAWEPPNGQTQELPILYMENHTGKFLYIWVFMRKGRERTQVNSITADMFKEENQSIFVSSETNVKG